MQKDSMEKILLEISLVFLDVSSDKPLKKCPVFFMGLRLLKSIIVTIPPFVWYIEHGILFLVQYEVHDQS